MSRVAKALGLMIAIAACGNDTGRAAHPVLGTRVEDAGREASATPAALPLVPRPRAMKRCEGALTIDASTRIAIDDAPESRAVGERLARWLGLSVAALDVVPAGAADPAAGIALRLGQESAAGATRRARDPAASPPRASDDEAYTLDVAPRRAVVRARWPAGLFYGAQTLAQLAGARRIGMEVPPLSAAMRWSVPCVAIEDAPRFPFRAMHLDVARHFFSKEVVERYVDLLTFYRFNVFHWHLTDDQGFRLEVKGHPELVKAGGSDGFYTQDEAREVIGFARDRFVTVVPEVEMPGHARAILAAHPELSCTGKQQEVPRTWGVFEDVLCAGNEKTYALLGDILGEVGTLFPSRLLHIGGDEVPTERWSACAKCRAAMKAGNVGIAGLEGAFMQRIESILTRLGKRPLVWDEALSGYVGNDTVILAWQSKDRGREAAHRTHDVVMAPHDHVYFNIHQSSVKGEPGHDGFLPWTKVRAFDPIPEGLEPTKTASILGGEGALWTEYVETRDEIDTMVMPRMAALSEALWASARSVEADFVARFGAQLPMLDDSRVRYFIEPPTGLRERRVFIEGDTTTVTIAPPQLFPEGVVRWTKGGSNPTDASPSFTAPITVEDTTTIAAALFLPGGRSSAVLRSTIVKERPRDPTVPNTPTRGADCTYVEGDFHRLPDFAKVGAKTRRRVSGIGLADAERAFGPSMRKERFALLFEGFVEVPVNGTYRFVARADDGVRVEVDGDKVLEDDGEHAPRDADGEIALRQGYHRVRIAYFQGSEGKELTVEIEGPGVLLRPLAVFVASR